MSHPASEHRVEPPHFRFRFIPELGNIILPRNYHPLGVQREAASMVRRALSVRRPRNSERAGFWVVVGGSGGYGSAARVALGALRGADTLNVAYDAAPDPEGPTESRQLGSAGWHRSHAIETELASLGLVAESHLADLFAGGRVDELAARLKREGRRLAGMVWAMATLRAASSPAGRALVGVVKPMGQAATVKTLTRRGDESPRIQECSIGAASVAEAAQTQYLMGGTLLERVIAAFIEQDVLAQGFQLFTLGYRGGSLNRHIYGHGTLGLAKADLALRTECIDQVLKQSLGGSAVSVMCPAAITEAAGGIPGVPLYMALGADVAGPGFCDCLDPMLRLFSEGSDRFRSVDGPLLLDDRELADDTQRALDERSSRLKDGDEVELRLLECFLAPYRRLYGFSVPGIDYEAPIDLGQLAPFARLRTNA
jgi:enoyl-[acyl-carrier protein] reductase / trans-2-enoyl-CoA reductase (NAD+)